MLRLIITKFWTGSVSCKTGDWKLNSSLQFSLEESIYSLGMKDLGTTCRDVRTREVGIQEIHNKVKPYEVELIRRDYYANDGWETFLSYEV